MIDYLKKLLTLVLRSTPVRIALFLGIVLIIFISVGGLQLFHPSKKPSKAPDFVSFFSDTTSLVKDEYVERINPAEKFPKAFSGLLGELDKFSTYLEPSQTEIYNLYIQNKTCTCGIYGIRLSGYFLITDVLEGSPAQKAGVEPGYIIRMINGKSIFGLSYWQMLLSLLSVQPREIELIICKELTDIPKEIKLRTVLPQDHSLFKPLEKDIFLLTLPRIDNEHISYLEKRFKKDIPPGKPLKLIIDLRHYDNGDLESFLRLSRLLFTHSVSLTLKKKNVNQMLFPFSENGRKYDAVVIVDKSTIMYGELLAHLFHANRQNGKMGNITLIGDKTRGFASELVQIVLEDGSSILLTEGFFYLNEKNPAKTGVEPDIKIKSNASSTILDRCISILKNSHG